MKQEYKNAIAAMAVFDIDGVIRDVGGSYRRALADTVENFTGYRPTPLEIDRLKGEGKWNNDWEASQELIYRYFEATGKARDGVNLDYKTLVAFFQGRYRGENTDNSDNWTGYICQETLLVRQDYFDRLTERGVPWGFFSGATRGSATYILEKRLGLRSPILVAMEDAPGKPDPTGLLATVAQLEQRYSTPETLPAIYAGDTVADLYTVREAARVYPHRPWIGVGILPPHVQETAQSRDSYAAMLREAGATLVLEKIEALDGDKIQEILDLHLKGV